MFVCCSWGIVSSNLTTFAQQRIPLVIELNRNECRLTANAVNESEREEDGARNREGNDTQLIHTG